MAKINITKPTGSVESLNVLSIFKADNNIYVILDSEKMGSMGLPIIYVSKYTTKLEKINDANEWQSVKNYLKGIISGANFEYTKLGDNINGDEAYYTPLTLPQSSFEAIKSHYKVEEISVPEAQSTVSESPKETVMNLIDDAYKNIEAPSVSPNMPINQPLEGEAQVNEPIPAATLSNFGTVPDGQPNVAPGQANVSSPKPKEAVTNLIDDAYKNVEVPSVSPSMPINQPLEGEAQVNEPIPAATLSPDGQPTVAPVPATPPLVSPSPAVNEEIASSVKQIDFARDKETFLKACENMFDALISKYQTMLNDLELREQDIARKEGEINAKMSSAAEHLKNAEAREQVANIAHDNAQRVMDINAFMPTNSDQNSN